VTTGVIGAALGKYVLAAFFFPLLYWVFRHLQGG
jgi:hypothetical protein